MFSAVLVVVAITGKFEFFYVGQKFFPLSSQIQILILL